MSEKEARLKAELVALESRLVASKGEREAQLQEEKREVEAKLVLPSFRPFPGSEIRLFGADAPSPHFFHDISASYHSLSLEEHR